MVPIAVSPTSPLHLPYISLTSPVHLPQVKQRHMIPIAIFDLLGTVGTTVGLELTLTLALTLTLTLTLTLP